MLSMDKETIEQGDFLRFGFGKRSFSESAPRLRKDAIKNRVDYLSESYSDLKQFK